MKDTEVKTNIRVDAFMLDHLLSEGYDLEYFLNLWGTDAVYAQMLGVDFGEDNKSFWRDYVGNIKTEEGFDLKAALAKTKEELMEGLIQVPQGRQITIPVTYTIDEEGLFARLNDNERLSPKEPKPNRFLQKYLEESGKKEEDLTKIITSITVRANRLKDLIGNSKEGESSAIDCYILQHGLSEEEEKSIFGEYHGYEQLLQHIKFCPVGWDIRTIKEMQEQIVNMANPLTDGITIKLPLLVVRDDKEIEKLENKLNKEYQEMLEEEWLMQSAKDGEEIASVTYTHERVGGGTVLSDATVYTYSYNEEEDKYYCIKSKHTDLDWEYHEPYAYEVKYKDIVKKLVEATMHENTYTDVYSGCYDAIKDNHISYSIYDDGLEADVEKAVNEKIKSIASEGNVLAEVTLISDINAYEATRYDKIRFVQKDDIYYEVRGDEEDFEEEASARMIDYDDMIYLLSDAYALKTGQELKYNQFGRGAFISSIDFKDEYLKEEAFLNTKEGDRYCESVEEMLEPYRKLSAEVIKNAAEKAVNNEVGLLYTDYNPQVAILECYICPAEISGFEPDFFYDKGEWKGKTEPSDVKWFEIMFNNYSNYIEHGELEHYETEGQYGYPFGITADGNIVNKEGLAVTEKELSEGYNKVVDDIQHALHGECLTYKDFIDSFNTESSVSSFEHELTEDEWHKQIERRVTQDITDSINAGAGVMSKDLHEEKPKKYRKSVYERD